MKYSYGTWWLILKIIIVPSDSKILKIYLHVYPVPFVSSKRELRAYHDCNNFVYFR